MSKEHTRPILRKINQKYLFLLVIISFFSYFLIKPVEQKELNLVFINGQQNQFIFEPEHQDEFHLILSRAIGATFNLDWYKICFSNGSNVTQRGVTTTPVILEVSIFPLSTNRSLLDLQKGLEFGIQIPDDFPGKQTSQMILGRRIAASVGQGGCDILPESEGGFEYNLSILNFRDVYGSGSKIPIPISLPNIGSLKPYPLDPGPIIDSRQLNLGTTTLKVIAAEKALILKRIIFILLAFGLIESLITIRKKIYPG